MRKMIFLQILLVFFACQKDNVMEGQDIQIPLEGKTSEEIPINHLHLFAIDRDNRIVRQETFTHEDIRKNSIHAILPLGRYRLALVANAFDNGINIPGAGNTLESILLCLPREGEANQEAHAIFTALQSVSITESKHTLPPIRLTRRTGTIEISLHSIPERVSNLKLELSFVPSVISFTGSNTNTFGTITKSIDHQGETTIRTFPAKKGETTLSVTYDEEGVSKRKIIPFSEAIDTSQIIHVDENFPELNEGGIRGNGKNLLQNGDFETWNTSEKRPDNWYFYKDGRDSIAQKVTGTKARSGQSVYLQGKTYLYQDVKIEAGKRYEIKMHVNAPSVSFPWKYYCYWRKTKSTALPAEHNKPIQAPNYKYRTDGWSDIFHGVFTAPEGAKLLRVEIRTYGKEIIPEEGIYIDDFSVELVE
ncbi:hypothetical protein [Butyricimonas faecihominis]|uniref:hypothetical protein n=1 Tax=Butyricimonas faecihominis TaxID=1472416 RepID=UPI00266F3EF9|nr:hypothetical protein [Butyricimonas faecihominis]